MYGTISESYCFYICGNNGMQCVCNMTSNCPSFTNLPSFFGKIITAMSKYGEIFKINKQDFMKSANHSL